jgi:mono/diheme cytochrome c family protein
MLVGVSHIPPDDGGQHERQELKPSKAVVVRQATNGGGGMPAFGGRLSAEQIDAIAAYVASSAGKK